MKQIPTLILLAFLLVACNKTTLEDFSFKATGTTQVLATDAMKVWLDYKNTNPVPPDQVARVKTAWDAYYQASQAEKDAVIAYKTSSDTNALSTAVSVVSASQANLIGLVLQFLPPSKVAQLKGLKL